MHDSVRVRRTQAPKASKQHAEDPASLSGVDRLSPDGERYPPNEFRDDEALRGAVAVLCVGADFEDGDQVGMVELRECKGLSARRFLAVAEDLQRNVSAQLGVVSEIDIALGASPDTMLDLVSAYAQGGLVVLEHSAQQDAADARRLDRRRGWTTGSGVGDPHCGRTPRP